MKGRWGARPTGRDAAAAAWPPGCPAPLVTPPSNIVRPGWWIYSEDHHPEWEALVAPSELGLELVQLRARSLSLA